jgi:DNA invertase Pin-like site-specific DNA recombinase
MQVRDLRQLARQRGFEIVAEYADEGVSGSKDSRPALDALLNSARRGKFQAILIWRLDRLGRSLQHLVRLFEQFGSWNVALISFSEGLDFSTSMGKLFYQLSGAFAEFERDTIRERVRAGMRNARASGKHVGRPPKTYLDQDARRSMWEVHQRGGVSLRDLAMRFSTSVGTVQRTIQAYQRLSG